MRKNKRIMILVADADSTFTVSCSDRYEGAVKDLGAEVRRFILSEMDFDPVLHKGYQVIQELEQDLLSFQEAVRWADHLVFAYPNWWSTMPAKLKGVFDRAFHPGFAFEMKNGKKDLLKGKSGRIINISGHDNPSELLKKMGPFTNELENGILRWCGVDPVSVTCFGPTRESGRSPSEEQRKIYEQWLQEVEEVAKEDVL